MNRVRPPGDRHLAPAPSSEEAERLAKDLLDRTRAETTQAENKAAIILAGILAGSGGIASANGGKWIPIHQHWYVAVPFWVAAAAVLAAVACLAAAIYPRSRVGTAHKRSTIGYFGDVVALGSASHLDELLHGSSIRLVDVWVDQIWQTSVIVNRKYRLVRWSVRFLGAALLLAVIAVTAAAIRSG